jgi:hypothetical protein
VGQRTQRRAEEPGVLAHVLGFGVREAHLKRRPVGSSRDAASAHPDRQQKLRCVARGGKPSWPAVAKPGARALHVEFHEVGVVNESLIPTNAFVGGPERRAGHNRVEVDVGRSDIRMLRQVEPEVRIAGRVHGPRDQRHHHAHRNPRVGIVQRRLVETDQCEKRLGVVSHGRQAGDQRLHGARTVKNGSGEAMRLRLGLNI